MSNQQTYRVGDIANGHQLDPDNVWRPVQHEPKQTYRVGDVANGHVLTQDNVWEPLPPWVTAPLPAPRKSKMGWWFAAGCVALLFIIGVAAGNDSTQPYTASNNTSTPDAAPPAPSSTSVAESGQPFVFDELGCDTVRSHGENDILWTCEKAGGPPAWYYPNDSASEDDMMMELGFDLITTHLSQPGQHHYNPGGDVFFVDDEGVLYLPGAGDFGDAMLALTEPDDIYGASVVDTDVL